MNTAEYWIQKLQLKPHPEGGFYKETYRSNLEISPNNLPVGFNSNRKLCTSIYYLLRSGEVSKLHRLRSDELWFYHSGSALKLTIIDYEGKKTTGLLGHNIEKTENFQLLIPAGSIFGAEVVEPDTYSLFGCVVAPGFEFVDFELFEKEDLINAFPKHEKTINRLC